MIYIDKLELVSLKDDTLHGVYIGGISKNVYISDWDIYSGNYWCVCQYALYKILIQTIPDQFTICNSRTRASIDETVRALINSGEAVYALRVSPSGGFGAQPQ